MPIEFSLLDRGAGMRYMFTGLVTGKELIDVNTSMYASEKRLKKLRYAIVDQTHMDSLDLSFTDLKKIEAMDRLAAQVNPSVVVAIIVEKDLPFNISKAWDVRTQDISWDKKIFGSKDEAYAWVREKVREKFGEEITITT
jgi:hypothetical protein